MKFLITKTYEISLTVISTTCESQHVCVSIQTHTHVYLATNLFLTFIFKNWCLYMKHLRHYTSRAFIKVINWLFGGLRKRGEENIRTLFTEICCKIKGVWNWLRIITNLGLILVVSAPAVSEILVIQWYRNLYLLFQASIYLNHFLSDFWPSLLTNDLLVCWHRPPTLDVSLSWTGSNHNPGVTHWPILCDCTNCKIKITYFYGLYKST